MKPGGAPCGRLFHIWPGVIIHTSPAAWPAGQRIIANLTMKRANISLA